jgi:hypothetical protein
MTTYILIILFAVAVIIIGPLATIWSLNALFPVLAIPVSFDTWVAALILGAVVGGHGLVFSKK